MTGRPAASETSETVRPTSSKVLGEVLDEAAEHGRVVVVHGGRTKMGWQLDRGPTADVAIDMTGLSGIIAHDHGDMTATVYGGTPLATIQTALAEHGQRLAIDPPLGRQREATIGGVFASDDGGPGRVSYGTLRELCIGAHYTLVDGTTAKTGSKVIKNVAGFDMGKLLCGSRGTLAIVTEMTVRLHPIPASEATVRTPMSFDDAAAVAGRLAGSIVADGLTMHSPDLQSGALWIRMVGPRGLVQTQVETVRQQVEPHATGDIEVLDQEQSRRAWSQAIETRRPRDGESVVAISVPPRHAVPLAGSLVMSTSELTGVRMRSVADAALGFVLVMLSHESTHEPADPSRVAQAVAHLRSVAKQHHGHARLRDRIPGITDHVDPFGPLPSSLPVMQRIKNQLDPDGRLAPHRYLTQP